MMKITLATVRALAERSGFSLVKTEGGYHIVEDDTGRHLPNAQGGTSHETPEAIFESLTERN